MDWKIVYSTAARLLNRYSNNRATSI